MRCRHLAAALALVATLCATPAQAGRTCEARPLTVQALQQGLELAERTARWLDASGAQVAVIARVGQDLSRYGLRYSHLGLAYREMRDGQPVWRVVHKLNQCGSDRAALYRQGLGEFFLDDLHAHEAGIVLLAPQVQAPSGSGAVQMAQSSECCSAGSGGTVTTHPPRPRPPRQQRFPRRGRSRCWPSAARRRTGPTPARRRRSCRPARRRCRRAHQRR